MRGAYHVHSTRSDGTGTLDEIAAPRARAGLQFVVVTDHGNGTRAPEPPAYRSGVLCIDGVEISTEHGHYVALGLPRRRIRSAGHPRDVIDDVRRLRRVWLRRASGIAKAGAAVGGWERALRRPGVAERRQRMARRVLGIAGPRAADLCLSSRETLAGLLDRPGHGAAAVGSADQRRARSGDRRRRRARAPRFPPGRRSVRGSRDRAACRRTRCRFARSSIT